MVEDEEVKASFEKVCVYMNKFSEFIPLSFLLGFYVSQVHKLWPESKRFSTIGNGLNIRLSIFLRIVAESLLLYAPNCHNGFAYNLQHHLHTFWQTVEYFPGDSADYIPLNRVKLIGLLSPLLSLYS